MDEEMAVFKSYCRKLLRVLLELKKALDQGDIAEAKRLTDELIKDTQADIED